jgi:hypothetical protein
VSSSSSYLIQLSAPHAVLRKYVIVRPRAAIAIIGLAWGGSPRGRGEGPVRRAVRKGVVAHRRCGRPECWGAAGIQSLSEPVVRRRLTSYHLG